MKDGDGDLLDAHVVVRWLDNPERLSAHAAAILNDEDTTALVSAVSFWEIAITCSVGQLRLQHDWAEMVTDPEVGLDVLNITPRHAIVAGA